MPIAWAPLYVCYTWLQFEIHPALNMFPPVRQQCWSRKDRRVHHPQHRAGEDEVRRSGGHLPDCQDAAHPEARHRSDRGERSRCYYSVSNRVHAVFSNTCSFSVFPVTDLICICLPPGPVPVLLPGQSGVSGKLWSLCNINPVAVSHATSPPSALLLGHVRPELMHQAAMWLWRFSLPPHAEWRGDHRLIPYPETAPLTEP